MHTCEYLPAHALGVFGNIVFGVMHFFRLQLACANGTYHHIPAERRASVALILRACPSGHELLFIVRAKNERDRWSGEVGFPGGRMQRGARPHAPASQCGFPVTELGELECQ